ncbi:hypothetical protein HaLaN_13400, partial [Haematococcus lacustris]
MDPLSGA